MQLIKNFTFAILCLLPILLYAQPQGDVHMLDMSNSLPYVIAFYVVTFVSLSLMMLKLLRPNFPTYWLYISCTIGILGGAIVTWAFDDIQHKQLPKIEYVELDENEMSPQMKEKLMVNKRNVENQKYANFWIITIPNFIMLGLGVFTDLNNRKRDPNKPRGRYD